MESPISFEIPSARDFSSLSLQGYLELMQASEPNYSRAHHSGNLAANHSRTFPHHSTVPPESPIDYSSVVVIIWIIVIVGFFAVSFVFCVFSCLFYKKIREWNRTCK